MAFLDNNFYGGIGFGGGPNPYSGMGGMQNNNIYGPQPFNDVISLNYQNGGGAAATPSSGVSVSPVVNPRPSILTPPSSGGNLGKSLQHNAILNCGLNVTGSWYS